MTIDAEAPSVEALTAEISRLERQVYVPGLWRCAKCSYQLMQANLNTADGTVTARDKPGERCPNCDTPLWRVTERESGNQLVERLEQEVARSAALAQALEVAKGRIELLMSADLPDSDHPTATRRVLEIIAQAQVHGVRR